MAHLRVKQLAHRAPFTSNRPCAYAGVMRFLSSCALCWLLLLTLALASGGTPAAQAAPRLPFAPGEVLEYELWWGPFPVGTITLTAQTVTLTDHPRLTTPAEKTLARPARTALHFTARTTSNEYADSIYMVRGTVQSWTDPGLRASLRYTKDQREGHANRIERVEFEPAQDRATFFLAGMRKGTQELPGQTLDPLAVFYWLRAYDGPLTPGSTISCTVSDGRSLVRGEAEVRRREPVMLPWKRYEDAYVIKPDLGAAGSVFDKIKDTQVTIWLSADQHRLPVKIQALTDLGLMSAMLRTHTPGTPTE